MPRERVFPGLHPILLPDEPQEELTKKCLGQIVANSSPIALWGGNDTWDVGGESRARGLQLLGVWCCCNTILSWISHPFLKFPSIFLLTNSVPSVAVIILHLLELVYLLKAKYCRKSQLPYPKDCLDWRYSWKEGRAQQCTEEGSWCLFPVLKKLEKSQGKPSYRKAKNQLLII